MAATIGTFPIKILAQVGDAEPIEIGTYEVPINIGTATPAHPNGTVHINCRGVAADAKEFAKDVVGNMHLDGRARLA